MLGENAYPLATVTPNGILFNGIVTIRKSTGSERDRPDPDAPYHNGRMVVQESTLDKYKKNPKK